VLIGLEASHVSSLLANDVDKLLLMVEVDSSHSEDVPVFERLFDCEYVGPGDVEVCAVDDIESGFSRESISRFVSFKLGDTNLWLADLEKAKCVI